MSEEFTSIHEFDYNLIAEYFSNLEQQGPGSPEATTKALSFIDNLSDESCIADIGCGTGGNTMELAKRISGKITAIDLSSQFIEQLNSNARKLNYHNRVNGIVGSMDNLQFAEEELDLIWSEGAIYHIGFERGLNEWRKFIKSGGYIAVSEATWFTNERPNEIEDFWKEAYSEIDTISSKVKQMQDAGYIPVATFILPENCWTDYYHLPQIPFQEDFLKRNAGNKFAEDFVSFQKLEMQMYNKYKSYYGYAFYIGKKI